MEPTSPSETATASVQTIAADGSRAVKREHNSSVEREDHSCAVCGKTVKLLRCSRCRSVYYCSQVHQKMDWINHKGKCLTIAKEENSSRPQSKNSMVQEQSPTDPAKQRPDARPMKGLEETSPTHQPKKEESLPSLSPASHTSSPSAIPPDAVPVSTLSQDSNSSPDIYMNDLECSEPRPKLKRISRFG